ncbi:MAG TPA: hypothetical protein VF510_06890 [Ktedonobacterales bacterium]
MPRQEMQSDPELPGEVVDALAACGVTEHDEVALRQELERRVPGYNLFRLTPAAVKRWKCRYRILLDAGYYDGQSAREAYARALLAVIDG